MIIKTIFQNVNKILLSIIFVVISSCTNLSNTKKIDIEKIDTKKDKSLKVAVFFDTNYASKETVEKYYKLLVTGISKKNSYGVVDLVSYDYNIEELDEAIENLSILGLDLIIIGLEDIEYNKKILQLTKNSQILVFTVSSNQDFASNRCYVFGVNEFKSAEAILEYYISNNFDNYLFLLPNTQSSLELSQKLKSELKNNDLALNKVVYYTMENINKAIRSISLKVDEINEVDSNLTKPILFILADYSEFMKIFDTALMFGLDKKATISSIYTSDIEYPKNISYSFSGFKELYNRSILEQFSDLKIESLNYKDALFYDLGLVIGLQIENIMSYIEKSKSLNINNEEFQGLIGPIMFKDNTLVRNFDIIQKHNNKYQVLTKKN